ncbi:MAG TPA: ribonuclease E/G, partial [Rhizobacter sp.]
GEGVAAAEDAAEPISADADVDLPPAVSAQAEPAPSPEPQQISAVAAAEAIAPVVEALANEPEPVRPSAAAVVVEPYVLNTEQLQAVAESAGLQWVNSDADKIRAVQEAMAREPKPVHVPREIKPVELVDEGPLVLVETRKDLSQIRLPFESQTPSQPSA